MSTTTDALVADEVDVRGTIETTARRWWRREFDEQAPATLVDLLAAAVEPYIGATPAGDSFAERRAQEVKRLTGQLDEARAERDSARAERLDMTGTAQMLRACVSRLVLAATESWDPDEDELVDQVAHAENLITQTVGRLDELVEQARAADAQRDAVAEATAGGLTAEREHTHLYVVDDETGELGACECGRPHPDAARAADVEPAGNCWQSAIEWAKSVGLTSAAAAKRQPHYWHLIDGDECTCESTEDGG